jgi:hypothetical protein
MSAKNIIKIILVLCSILTSCTQTPSPTEGFVQYDSTEYVAENDLSDRIPAFSFKHPLDWEHAWVGDSGIIGLLIASGDLEAAWKMRDYTGATMMIIPFAYAGQELTDLFYTTRIPVESYETTSINGQDAAWGETTINENLYIEVVIVNENWGLTSFAFFPPEKETEFRPVLEAIISTIEIK